MSDRGRSTYVPSPSFDRNSPRPPVPGEETAPCSSDWGAPPMDCWPKKSSTGAVRKYHSFPDSSPYNNYDPPDLKPPLPPRCDPLRLPTLSEDPISGVRETPSSSSTSLGSPPACIRWAQSLHALLQDPDGVKLFLNYLESEGPQHAAALHFWFACEGLRKESDIEKIRRLPKVIYRKFFVKSALPISEDLRREISKNIKSIDDLESPETLFDVAQEQLEILINNTTYPNFLKSDMYLQYVQIVQNNVSGSASETSSSSGSSRELANLNSLMGGLPTLHEDSEYIINPVSQPIHTPGTNMSTGYHTPNVAAPVRLTKDLLLMSQKRRAVDVRPKFEAFAGVFMRRNNVGSHAAYNSYNPVSRQDSELHSVSSHSDARTESDNMSLTDSSIDGRSLGRSLKRRAQIDAKHARQSAAMNKEQHMHQTLIPRTQRLDTKQCQPLHPDQFAAILMGKLEEVKRQRDTQELLDRKLKESESMSSLDCDNKVRMSDLQSRALANAIKEKLQLEDDNDQDILDQHVSRVFSDLTPGQTPGVASPRPHSPPRNRYNMAPHSRTRRDKDGFSTFSGDSGNVHDYADSEHRLAMVKSKSMPDYEQERFTRGTAGRRSSSKKTITEQNDSGVSVVSDTPPVALLQNKENRVLDWLIDSDRSSRSKSSTHTHSEMSMKHRSHRASSATSPNATRHRKGPMGYSRSRSSSRERNMVQNSNLGPAQPFVADPSMPPPPLPNTTFQLEEARRRLLEDDFRTRSRNSRSKYYPEMSQSNQSTLRKSTSRNQRLPSQPNQQMAPIATEELTTAVFTFSDEQFPYRTKIPGNRITFKQFKEYLPKKGNYRFFFKTICEELGNQVIQEEISNDSEIIPLWEGKIMVQAKPAD